MGKKLLSKDYDNIVFETFKLLESDYYNYYSNIIEENYKNNQNILTEIENSIIRWFDWYKSKLDFWPIWEVDEEGKKHRLNPYETLVPLSTDFGINLSVNKFYFDNQLRIIGTFKNLKITFNSFWEVHTTSTFPHLAQTVKSQKPQFELDFIITALNDDLDTAIDKLTNDFFLVELEQYNNIPTDDINKRLNILDDYLILLSKEQLVHSTKHKEENNLGARILKTRIKYLEIIKIELTKKLNTNQKSDNPKEFESSIINSHLEKIQRWCYSDCIESFVKIEKELLKREYLNEKYKWEKHKTELIEFLQIIYNFKFFKSVVDGKNKQFFHYRQFISELYGLGKTGLSETAKNHKPSIELAKATFFWLENPLNQ
jgi:hypothetical protein